MGALSASHPISLIVYFHPGSPLLGLEVLPCHFLPHAGSRHGEEAGGNTGWRNCGEMRNYACFPFLGRGGGGGGVAKNSEKQFL